MPPCGLRCRQVLAKAMTQKAMIFGVPFFVATLVKNAKMVQHTTILTYSANPCSPLFAS